jgi:Uma2 family endonuclease
MSTPAIPTIQRSPRVQIAPEPPPLNPGDHLSREEFHRRYEAHPEIKKAELIEGVVYMPSPIRDLLHSSPHSDIVTWLGVYRAATPGLRGGDSGTVLIDFENEVQPDTFIRILPEFGGRTRTNERDYVEGAPELVVAVAASSVAYDLYVKKRVYQQSGAPEYIVFQMHEERVDWFVLRDGVYASLAPDENGVIKS